MTETSSSADEVLNKIKSRGYWQVVIRPLRFKSERIDLDMCAELVSKCKVTLRGWDYPHVSSRYPPYNGLNWAESITDWSMFKEFWRFYQSGQFIHFLGCIEDWLAEDVTLFGPSKFANIKPHSILDVTNTLYTLTEIYEFASRLAGKNLFDTSLQIDIQLHGMKNRKLSMALTPHRFFRGEYICSISDLPNPPITITVGEIIGGRHDLSLDHALWIFKRFNWNFPNVGILKQDQKKFVETAS